MKRNLRTLVSKELKRFCNRIWPADVRIIRYRGLKWLLDRRNRVDRKIICGGYEEDQVDYLLAQAGPNLDYFLDIGANLGLYTLQVAAEQRARHVWAFEPDPRNYAQLLANLYLNGLTTRVQTYRCAASDAAGTAPFAIYPTGSTGQSRIAAGTEGIDKAIQVECTSIDTLLSCSGKTVAIKIDVEGHERAVLKGATALLQNNSCVLQIEAWPDRVAALIEMMASMGFVHIKTIHEDHYFTNNDR
ncbi:FkbM family methyltransferase [Ruixingdingia sedimenti]|uniref:FkbM family methyltransferase n=1 Tax=Ruixingdingia sedimenti TaxID=3073604 RepID=A0ABU1FEZ3_9RHOB|nr:FkbM family methyltransferase [Xinfangfangia sp. LG-4]MDR5655108.1 FkbM family methyltransferase [Xinfangfangia sp. LG-4]